MRIIKSTSVVCQYISSVTVITGDGGLFEFGYIIGYWGDGGPCTGVSQTTYYTQPTLFNYRETNTGSFSCTFFSNRHPPESSYQVFRASDVNTNYYWGSWYNNEELQPSGVLLDFVAGTVFVSMERGAGGDTGIARWYDIFEYHQSNGWTFTEDVERHCDLDPDYRYLPNNGHDGETTLYNAVPYAC